MDEQVIKVPTDRRIAALAERQHGVGDGAVASHRTAAAIWGIRPSASRRVEITAKGARARRKDILLHRNRLAAADITAVDGIPVTTPARTLVDLADVLSRRALERAFDEAEYLRLDCSGLAPVPGRRGNGRLAHVLSRHPIGTTRTRSRLEDRFLELCAAHELPRPRVNVRVGEYEVDFHFPDAGLVVELDGDAAHRTKRAFETDRIRDAELAVQGQRVIRITEERLKGAPAEVAGQLRVLTRTPR